VTIGLSSRLWDIHPLPMLAGSAYHPMQVGLAVLAMLNGLHNHFIGLRRQAQTLTRMALLSAWLFATWLAQTLLLPYKPIRGGRQMTMVALFAQSLFQRLHTLEQLRDQFVSLGQLAVSQRQLLSQCLILGLKLVLVFFWLHAFYFTRSSALLQACSET